MISVNSFGIRLKHSATRDSKCQLLKCTHFEKCHRNVPFQEHIYLVEPLIVKLSMKYPILWNISHFDEFHSIGTNEYRKWCTSNGMKQKSIDWKCIPKKWSFFTKILNYFRNKNIATMFWGNMYNKKKWFKFLISVELNFNNGIFCFKSFNTVDNVDAKMSFNPKKKWFIW